MKRTFIETSSFSRKVDKEGAETLSSIQSNLLKNPESGKVIQGTGGLRKIRLADPSRGKGKRGGYRVIYLDLPRVEKTYLLALYGKGEKDDISKEEKNILAALVKKLKAEEREND